MEPIERRIIFIRGRRVLLSTHLAELYGVEPRTLIQAVKRNRARFPTDFMFQLTLEEARSLKSQIVTLNDTAGDRSKSQIVTLKRGANIKKAPFAFTQEGVAMLSSVLRSPQAIKVNVEIMRAFVRMRYGLTARREVLKKMIELERRIYGHDADIAQLFEVIRGWMTEPDGPRKIGFSP